MVKSKVKKVEKKADANYRNSVTGDNMPIAVKKADVEQEVEIYWKQFNDGPKLAIKVTKGSKVVVILKDPKYLKSLRDHLQTVAKFGLRRNYI